MTFRLAAAFAAFPICALAQGADSILLDPVVVTATGSQTKLSELSASVTVIDRDQIERAQANDVSDLLRQVAGLDVAKSGGPGAPTSVFIRGAESNHTLFLIDGVRYTTETALNAQIQNLSPEAIERIEIVKGPRSARWGSDAIGGVVNLITRKAESGIGGDVRLRGGSYGTVEGGAHFNYGGSAGRMSLDVQAQQFDGFPPLHSGTRDLGHDAVNLSANGQTRIGWLGLDARHLQAGGLNEYSQFGVDRQQDYRNRVSALSLDAALGGWTTRLTASLAYDELLQREPGDETRPELRDYSEVTRRQLEWEFTGTAATVEWAVGLSTGSSEIDTVYYSSWGDSVTRDRSERHAAFAQARKTLGRYDGLIAVRRAEHDEFGGATTGNLELGAQLWTGTRLGVAAGTGFKEPELTDLYGDFGNPDLDPERSRSLEINLRQQFGERQLLTMALYQNDIDDLIAWADTGLFNVAETRTRGLEAGWQYLGESLRARLSGNLQNPKDETTGNRLLRRSAKSLQAGVDYRFGRFEPGLEIRAYGQRGDIAGAQMGGYAVVEARLRIELLPGLTLDLRGDNLLDKDYEEVDGYRTPGRSGYATLRYRY